MRTSRFTETQMIAILKEADGGMEASDLKKNRELEAENAKLKLNFDMEAVIPALSEGKDLRCKDSLTKSPFSSRLK